MGIIQKNYNYLFLELGFSISNLLYFLSQCLFKPISKNVRFDDSLSEKRIIAVIFADEPITAEYEKMQIDYIFYIQTGKPAEKNSCKNQI